MPESTVGAPVCTSARSRATPLIISQLMPRQQPLANDVTQDEEDRSSSLSANEYYRSPGSDNCMQSTRTDVAQDEEERSSGIDAAHDEEDRSSPLAESEYYRSPVSGKDSRSSEQTKEQTTSTSMISNR